MTAHGATPLALWIGRHVEAADGDVDRALTAMADELRDRIDVDPDDDTPPTPTVGGDLEPADPGVVTPAVPDQVDTMTAAVTLAHMAVALGSVDAATVFEVAGDATDGATVGNLVAVVQSLAALIAAVFREGGTPAEAVAAFEHAALFLAARTAPPAEDVQ